MKNDAVISSSSFDNFLKPTPLAMTDFSTSNFHSGSSNNSFQSSGSQVKKFQRNFKKSPLPFIIVVVILVVLIIIGINSTMKKSSANAAPASSTMAAQKTSAPKPLATETLNKTFQFPLKDTTGKVVSNIQYEIQNVEMDNQVIIKGQEATAIQGKTFLVLNLQITNNYDKAVQLNTRDYIRLIVNGDSTEKLAATIHNDPVDVEPISTTFTRLGFPIDTNAKSLALEVGEIDGTKQIIPLTIQY